MSIKMSISARDVPEFVWVRNSINILINAYETKPNLYKTNHPEYKLKNKRTDALNVIKTILFENGYDVSIHEINRKIHNLRTQFFKEYGKTKKGLVSGAGTRDLYVPKIWWYEQLTYLIDSDSVRESRSNIGNNELPGPSHQTNPNNNENIEFETPSQNTVTDMIYEGTVEELEEGLYLPNVATPSAKKRKNSSNLVEEETKTLIKNAANTLGVIRNQRPADFEAFGRMIAEELKAIGDQEEIRLAKTQILGCVMDAQERASRKKNL